MIYETLWLYFSFDHKKWISQAWIMFERNYSLAIVSYNLGTQQSLEELI